MMGIGGVGCGQRYAQCTTPGDWNGNPCYYVESGDTWWGLTGFFYGTDAQNDTNPDAPCDSAIGPLP